MKQSWLKPLCVIFRPQTSNVYCSVVSFKLWRYTTLNFYLDSHHYFSQCYFSHEILNTKKQPVSRNRFKTCSRFTLHETPLRPSFSRLTSRRDKNALFLSASATQAFHLVRAISIGELVHVGLYDRAFKHGQIIEVDKQEVQDRNAITRRSTGVFNPVIFPHAF